VLLDGETFSSTGYARSMGPVMGHTILEMDEPEHSRYRGLIQKTFGKRALDRWELELVTPIVNSLIDRFVARGHADLTRELTFPFPVTVIAGMIGLDDTRDRARRRRAAAGRDRPCEPRCRESRRGALPEPRCVGHLPNMAFASGAHRCLGLHLARMETTVALHELFDRLPNLRLDPAPKDVHISASRSAPPLTLPVLFDPV
jgi:cytochrome P450